MKNLLSNYLESLKRSWNHTNRQVQQQLIARFSIALTLGIAAVLLCSFYSVLPLPVRVLSLPAMAIFAWWLGKEVLAPQIGKKF